MHLLRLAGYRIGLLRALMPQLRQARRWDEVTGALAAREAALAARSLALLKASAALATLIDTA